VIDGLLKLQERIRRERPPQRPVENIHGKVKALDFVAGKPVEIVPGTVPFHDE
jgi:hypothetical protein